MGEKNWAAKRDGGENGCGMPSRSLIGKDSLSAICDPREGSRRWEFRLSLIETFFLPFLRLFFRPPTSSQPSPPLPSQVFLFFSQRFFPLSTPSPLPLRNPFLHFKEGANDLVNTRAVALIRPDPLDSCSSSRGPVWILIVGINDPRDSNEISTHRRKFV